MIRRICAASVAAVLLLGLTAAPALAISSIKNELSVNSGGVYASPRENTSWTARTSYGQYLVQNPYTSDFECLLNARHFRAPRSTRVSGTSSYWTYRSYDSATRGPAWRTYSGTFWVFQPRTVYNQFRATARNRVRRDWQRSALGQHRWSVSTGATDYQYTYHY